MRTLLFSLMSLCLLASCKKDELKSCPVKCTVTGITLLFQGEYSMEDIDTVVVKTYDYGEAFSQLDTQITYMLSDTMTFGDGYNNIGVGFKNLYLTVRRSYEISIPATGQTFKFWDIKDPNVVRYFLCSGADRYRCNSTITEFSVDGGEYQRVSTPYPATYLALKK